MSMLQIIYPVGDDQALLRFDKGTIDLYGGADEAWKWLYNHPQASRALISNKLQFKRRADGTEIRAVRNGRLGGLKALPNGWETVGAKGKATR